MDIIILKILLYVLLGILALLLAVCLLNVKITVGNKNGFGWRLTVGGIPINPALFFGGKKDKHKKGKDDKKQRKAKKDKGKSARTQSGKSEEAPKKKSASDTLGLILKIAQTAKDTLPKGFRIRLKYLNITVGGEDAERVAVGYGKFYALLSGMLALFDGYKGFLYGFYVKRNKITLETDYHSGKTTAEFSLSVSFFVWQLLWSGIRIGAAALTHIIKSSAENSDEADNGQITENNTNE
ncbi:MAG: hypothetical protein IKU43_02295 [Clostridia bacterium]|nr:hypothetical protein [Clostridia bacterium]